MRHISVDQRRRMLVDRHHLRGDAADPDAVARALVALHATDPATVYLSVLVRSAASTLADVAGAMYERRTLVRWMAMRRTLFLLPRDDVATVQAAVSTPLAAVLRRRLINQLHRNGTEPPIDGDLDRWLAALDGRVETALRTRGSATGAQLGADEPALRTTIVPRAPSDRPQNLTSALLTLMSAEGRLVRGRAIGDWTSRHHRWEPVDRWWPDGLPVLDTGQAQRDLARRWLARYGPATVEDLRWWTGWNATTTRAALHQLPVEEVDLHGEPGIDLTPAELREHADAVDDPADGPVAALLPTLDPTPMGWKRRDWFLGIPTHHLFDDRGNIGPTLWWNGEIIGSWASTRTGEIRTAVLADRGTAARHAVDRAAAHLHSRLDGAVITPAIRAPLERALAHADAGEPLRP